MIDRATIPEPRYPSYVEQLKVRTETAEKKLKERIQELEDENSAFRARLNKQLEKRVEAEKARLFQDFLEVLDNFERALEAAGENSDFEKLRDGVRLNLNLFLRALKNTGVETIDPLHEPFDPHVSEALGTVPVDQRELDQKVVQVVQKGYRIGDHLIRPATVNVGHYADTGT